MLCRIVPPFVLVVLLALGTARRGRNADGLNAGAWCSTAPSPASSRSTRRIPKTSSAQARPRDRRLQPGRPGTARPAAGSVPGRPGTHPRPEAGHSSAHPADDQPPGYPNWCASSSSTGCAVMSLQPTTADGLFAYWQDLGALTGREAEAQKEMIADFGRNWRASPRSCGPSRRKGASGSISSASAADEAFAPGSMACSCSRSAGGVNVAADAARMQGKEHRRLREGAHRPRR